MSSDRVRAEIALEWERIFGSSAVLVVNNIPPGIEFGIDSFSFQSGPRFRGICMIPEGMHFVYYGHPFSKRDGFFLHSTKNTRVVAKTWNEEKTEMQDNELSDNSYDSLITSIIRGDLNDSLAPYPNDQEADWKNLSRHLDSDVLSLNHIQPLVAFSAESDAMEITDSEKAILGRSPKPIHEKINDLVSVKPISFQNLRDFEQSYLEKNFYKIAHQINSMQLDKSWLLLEILKSNTISNPVMLLGQLELSFLTFLLIYCFEGLRFWKALVNIICCSESFLKSNIYFAKEFIYTLFNQLKFIPEDFFTEEISKDSFLMPSLTSLFSSLVYQENEQSKFDISELLESSKRLQKFLFKKFLIKFSHTVIIQNADESKLQDIVDPNDLVEEEAEHCEVKSETIHQITPSDNVASVVEEKFSWRYPLLFEQMRLSDGREDMLMTAVRLLDENVTDQRLYEEIIRFIENESRFNQH
jgi:A1 cistron-splicing factor AAR2